MIYDPSIRDYLTPISEITEESGYVCFYGEVIGVECREIKSKKTEKEFFIAKFSVN